MADAASKFSPSDENFIVTTSEFETSVKERLKWSKQKWLASGESGTRINRLCSSVNYWKDKLKPAIEDTSIIITLFNVNNDVRISLFHVIDAIEKLDINVSVVGVADFRNPRYICIYFKSKEEKERVVANFKMYENNFVVYMEWALESLGSLKFLKVHWMPITLDIEVIAKELESYVKCVEHERKILTSMSGREVISGRVEFRVIVNKGVKIEDIPHVMTINDMEALITIPGRKPLCLNCNILGHISRDCQLRFCSFCYELLPREHKCDDSGGRPSYAAKLKKGNKSDQMEDCGDIIFIEKSTQALADQSLLTEKIIGLEKEISEMEKENDLQVKTRLEKKRKAVGEVKEASEVEGSASQSNGEEVQSSGESCMDDETSQGEGENVYACFSQDLLAAGENQIEDVETGCIIKKEKKNRSVLVGAKAKAIENKADKENELSQRSYGKPKYRNQRRVSQEEKFDKLLTKSEKREFVFDD